MKMGRKDRLDAGLLVATAAFMAGVVVIFVSLPLRSPHDTLINSGTIAIAVVLTAFSMSVATDQISHRWHVNRSVVAVATVGFVLASVAAVLTETTQDLERSISFIVPLAAIQFGLTAALTPLLQYRNFAIRWLFVAVLVAVMAIGFSFASDGDQESGRLELPARTQ